MYFDNYELGAFLVFFWSIFQLLAAAQATTLVFVTQNAVFPGSYSLIQSTKKATDSIHANPTYNFHFLRSFTHQLSPLATKTPYLEYTLSPACLSTISNV